MNLIEDPRTLAERIVNAICNALYESDVVAWLFDDVDDERKSELIVELVKVVQKELDFDASIKQIHLPSIRRSRRVKISLYDYVRLRDGGVCIYCKDEVGQVIDHVLSKSFGGPTKSYNLVLACFSCNTKKRGLNERYMALGFKHLLDVGESLAWISIEDSEEPAPRLDPIALPETTEAQSEELRNEYIEVVASRRPPTLQEKIQAMERRIRKMRKRLERKDTDAPS